mmetsp:Transcript_88025/g.204833  ORF Transcript_88025/g.204833 Transcript_88025/m.204833 type:complete len:215 (-) Transcript_88025:163-807(-)
MCQVAQGSSPKQSVSKGLGNLLRVVLAGLIEAEDKGLALLLGHKTDLHQVGAVFMFFKPLIVKVYALARQTTALHAVNACVVDAPHDPWRGEGPEGDVAQAEVLETSALSSPVRADHKRRDPDCVVPIVLALNLHNTQAVIHEQHNERDEDDQQEEDLRQAGATQSTRVLPKGVPRDNPVVLVLAEQLLCKSDSSRQGLLWLLQQCLVLLLCAL